mgnify:CR=1 FL=1
MAAQASRRRDRLFGLAGSRTTFAMVQPNKALQSSSAALRTIGESRGRVHRRIGADREWQSEAYELCDRVGELGYLLWLKANTVAMCDLEVEVYDAEKREWTIPEGEARSAVDRVMNAFVGPFGGQTDLKRRAAFHLCCAGETYMLGTIPEVDGANDEIVWEFLSVDELRRDSDGRYRRRRDGGEQVMLPDEYYVARCWRGDPRYSDLATSEVKRALPICREIVALDQMVTAIARSRLPAKILVVPEEASFASQEEDTVGEYADDVDGDAADIDPFIEELFQHINAAVTDPSSAARLAPLVMRMKGELTGFVQVIDLARDVDSWASGLRKDARDRLAQALDTPPETLTGKASLSHWSGVNVDEDFVVKHVAPLGGLFAEFVAFAYLRPMLVAYEGFAPEEAAAFRVRFSTDKITARPDASGAARAIEEYLTTEALLRANGFEASDAATEEERHQRRMWTLILANPQMFAKLLLPQMAGFENVDVEKLNVDAAGPAPSATGPAATAPAADALPANGGAAPATRRSAPTDTMQAALLAERLAVGADAALTRAVDRATSRLVSATSRDSAIRDRLAAASRAHAITLVTDAELGRFGLSRAKLLDGAWDDYAAQARGWIRDWLIGSGMDNYAADDRAAFAASMLCERLSDLAERASREGTRVGPNGLKVPGALIDAALQATATYV